MRKIFIVSLVIVSLIIIVLVLVFNSFIGINLPTFIDWKNPFKTIVEIKCETLEGNINALIEKNNYCDVDADCILMDHMECPFGCYRLVNKNADLKEIKESMAKYFKKCMRCVYECLGFPKLDEIKCENKKCVDIRFRNLKEGADSGGGDNSKNNGSSGQQQGPQQSAGSTSEPRTPKDAPCDDQCNLNLAKEKLDESSCSKITAIDLQYQCFGGIAVLKKDTSLCQKAGNYKDQCIFAIANAGQSGNECNIIVDPAVKDICFAEIARQQKNWVFCQDISGQETHDWCLRDIAVMLDNEAPCPNIKDVSLKNMCYMDIAVLKRDSSLCDLSGDLKQTCLGEVSKNQ